MCELDRILPPKRRHWDELFEYVFARCRQYLQLEHLPERLHVWIK